MPLDRVTIYQILTLLGLHFEMPKQEAAKYCWYLTEFPRQNTSSFKASRKANTFWHFIVDFETKMMKETCSYKEFEDNEDCKSEVSSTSRERQVQKCYKKHPRYIILRRVQNILESLFSGNGEKIIKIRPVFNFQ